MRDINFHHGGQSGQIASDSTIPLAITWQPTAGPCGAQLHEIRADTQVLRRQSAGVVLGLPVRRGGCGWWSRRRRTSCFRIRPPTPVPATVARSTPSRWAAGTDGCHGRRLRCWGSRRRCWLRRCGCRGGWMEREPELEQPGAGEPQGWVLEQRCRSSRCRSSRCRSSWSGAEAPAEPDRRREHRNRHRPSLSRIDPIREGATACGRRGDPVSTCRCWTPAAARQLPPRCRPPA